MPSTRVSSSVRDWLSRQTDQIPNYCGAHLVGSAAQSTDEATHPKYVDVDLVVICNEAPVEGAADLPYPGFLRNNDEFEHDGLLLEIVYFSKELYASPETILVNPTIAGYLQPANVMDDPNGWLIPLSETVTAEFSRRRWVRARAEHQLPLIEGSVNQAKATEDPAMALFSLAWAAKYAASLVAIAHLRQPTHRRCLQVMDEILMSSKQEAHVDAVRDFLGVQELSEPQIARFVDQLDGRFDRACDVMQTPVPFGFKIQPHVKPYLVEGSREIMRKGDPRNAMFWIIAGLFVTAQVILNDGTDDDRQKLLVEHGELLQTLGFTSPSHVGARIAAAEKTLESVRKAAFAEIEKLKFTGQP